MSRFASVVLDADSTLAGIEGIAWLARLRGPEIAARVATVTDDAMAGSLALESVYERRLELIMPTHEEVAALSRAYLDAVAPGARAAIADMLRGGVTVRVVSGGIRQALLPLTRELGLSDGAVEAVDVVFDPRGDYAGIVPSPLTTDGGKGVVVRRLALPRPVLAVGDGSTDLAMRPEVDAFAAFVGFVSREPVVAGADFVVTSFAEVTALLSRGRPAAGSV